VKTRSVMEVAETIYNKAQLTKLTVNRISWRLHPYLDRTSGWRTFPSTLSTLLRSWEPAHLITISNDLYVVDGRVFKTSLNAEQKIEAAKRALKIICQNIRRDAVYPKVLSSFIWRQKQPSEKDTKKQVPKQIVMANERYGKIRTFRAAFKYKEAFEKEQQALIIDYRPSAMEFEEQNTSKHLIIAFDSHPFFRFAYRASLKTIGSINAYLPDTKLKKGGIVGVNDHEVVTEGLFLPISENFFDQPNTSNVNTLGDLILLSQAKKNWCVNCPVKIAVSIPRATGRKVIDSILDMAMLNLGTYLERTVGFQSFQKHACLEQLIGNPEHHKFWHRMTKATQVLNPHQSH